MNDPAQPLSNTGAIDIHEPFTRAERIQQLSEVDNDIAHLLTHLSTAMRALATPPGTSVPQPPSPSDSDIDMSTHDTSDTADPLTTFQTAQTAFFQTVDRIDKQLSRQLYALEEAGIVTLRGSGAANTGEVQQQQQGGQQLPPQLQQQQQQQVEQGVKAAAGGRLEPDGLGKYGGLDVGRLNMASSRVEREMEGEMWRKGREHLEGVVGRGGTQEDGDRMEE